MADMGAMEMPLPDNTLPMMTGQGPYGAMEMGGMFTTVKVRRGLARDDYNDPGWYKQPSGHASLRVDRRLPEPTRGATVLAHAIASGRNDPRCQEGGHHGH